MSRISIHQFAARRDVAGELRIAEGEPATLNKGTLGQRIASWWRDVREHFGAAFPDRVRRQEQAIEAFKASLAGYYDDEIAQHAIGSTEIGRGGKRLTGRVVAEAIDFAVAASRRNAGANLSAMNRLRPPPAGAERTPAFLDFLQSMHESVPDPSDDELQEYDTRFRSRVEAQDLGKPIPQERLEAIAKETLQQVRKLGQEEKLDDALAARQELEAALGKVVEATASDPTTRETLARLFAAVSRLNRCARVETGKPYPDDVKEFIRGALKNAMDALAGKDPGLIRQAQSHALSIDSSLRAIYAEIGERLDRATPRQRDALSAVRAISEALIEGFGEMEGARSVSVMTDVERLGDGQMFSTFDRRSAAAALDQALEEIAASVAAPEIFIADLKAGFAVIDRASGELQWQEGDNGPAWNSVALQKMLEDQVPGHQRRDGISAPQAIANFRTAIDADDTLPLELKQRLATGLDALDAPTSFLADLRARYVQGGQGEVVWRDDWVQDDLLMLLEEHVRGKAEWDETASARIRAAIEADQTLPARLKDDLAAGLDDLDAEAQHGYAIMAPWAAMSALRRAIEGLAGDSSPETMMNRLSLAVSRLDRLQEAEIGKEYGADLRNTVRQMLKDAMAELDDAVVVRARAIALARGSVLNAIHLQMAATEREQAGLPEADRLSPRQREAMKAVQVFTETLVEAFGEFKGPQRGTITKDVERLRDRRAGSPERLSQVAEALGPWLDRVSRTPAATVFLAGIKDKFADVGPEGVAWHVDDDDFPLWNSIALLETLEEHVRRHQEHDKVSVREAVANFRAAIDPDRSLPQGLKDKLQAGLDALDEEERLGEQFRAHPKFGRLRAQDFWRLFAPRRVIGETAPKWALEHTQQGSLAGMSRAFGEMVEMPEGGELTSNDLERMHQRAVEGTLNGTILRLGYKEDANEEIKGIALEAARMRTEFRDQAPGHTPTLTMREAEVSETGLQELRPPHRGGGPLVPARRGEGRAGRESAPIHAAIQSQDPGAMPRARPGDPG